MTDQFSLCLAEYMTQLRTLSASYFPAITGRAAGWQVSENDTVVMEGGTYFVVCRPGVFTNPRRANGIQDNVWHVRTFLYMKFEEYEGLWALYRAFRSDILNLPDTAPLKNHGIYGQSFSATDEAGYLRDENNNYLGFVQQTLDCSILQRVAIARAL